MDGWMIKTLALICKSVCCVSSSADRCIQNIYRQLRQDSGHTKKYPGVLASLLMLDKLSIEDIKASVTELMAGGVDTVIKSPNMTFVEDFHCTGVVNPCVFYVSDVYHIAVDII